MSRNHVLAIDQGTTGTTALLFDEKTTLRGRGYSEFAQHYPKPGWVEHDPEEIWTVTREVIKAALEQAGIAPADLAAIGITNQRETTVIWERISGKPIAPAIVWQCRRTSETCERLKKEGHESMIRSKTGLLLDPYFSATKIAWILDHVSGARAMANEGKLAFGTIDSWLIWRLTHGKIHATDFTNASRTLLFDIHQRKWSEELCDLFHVPISLLPDVRDSIANFGEAHELSEKVSIRGVAGDQQAALFGHYATEPGEAKCTFGTGAFALTFAGKNAIASKSGLLTTLAADKDGKAAYALEGSIFMSGAIIQWLRDGLKIISSASETEKLARSIPNTGGVYLVPAFVGLGAPHWKSEARAAIVGMTRGTSRAEIVRAGLEAMALQTYDLFQAMATDLGSDIAELRIDGGAAANNFLAEQIAGLLRIKVVRPSMLELTGFGAARLAAIGVGLWDRTHSDPGKSTVFVPSLSEKTRLEMIEGWQKALSRVLLA